MIYGDGRQERDFVYVGDVVAAMLATVGRNGGPFNIGTGVATSVSDLHIDVQPTAGSHRDHRCAGDRGSEERGTAAATDQRPPGAQRVLARSCAVPGRRRAIGRRS